MDFLFTPMPQWLQLALIVTVGLLSLLLFAVLVPTQQEEPDLKHLQLIDDVVGCVGVEHWANVFVDNNLRGRGLTFEQFMTNPRGWLQVLVFTKETTSEEPLPLLPAQVVVYERVLRQDLEAQERDRLQEKALEALESKYATVSNSGGRLRSSMSTRKQPRKWQTRGHHYKPA